MLNGQVLQERFLFEAEVDRCADRSFLVPRKHQDGGRKHCIRKRQEQVIPISNPQQSAAKHDRQDENETGHQRPIACLGSRTAHHDHRNRYRDPGFLLNSGRRKKQPGGGTPRDGRDHRVPRYPTSPCQRFVVRKRLPVEANADLKNA